jgi:N-acyl-D-aspartate/D-glutamate deacylase
MSSCDTLIRGAYVFDGSGADPEILDVALRGGRIAAIAPSLDLRAGENVEAEGLALAPGFIDVHTHDDLCVLNQPAMLPKLSQGVTTVIVGNCGISASPVRLHGELPDPMNLLGRAEDFRYSTFTAYVEAIRAARPGDGDKIREAFRNLEAETIYTRFFAYKTEVTDAELARITGSDFDQDVALLVTVGSNGTETVIGGAS